MLSQKPESLAPPTTSAVVARVAARPVLRAARRAPMASFAPPGEPTPSMRDGYSASEEKKKRRQTSWYISECGLALKLPKLPVLTAQHYFQKFYQAESFKAHDRFHVAMACLFLAAKVEESPARLGKLVATYGAVRHPKAPPLDQQSEAFAATKHEVLVKERALLYAIGFDVSFELARALETRPSP